MNRKTPKPLEFFVDVGKKTLAKSRKRLKKTKSAKLAAKDHDILKNSKYTNVKHDKTKHSDRIFYNRNSQRE